jgi:hypothetical protein
MGSPPFCDFLTLGAGVTPATVSMPPAAQAIVPHLAQRLKRSLSIGRFCFKIGHIAVRHGKPHDDLPADFAFGAG